MKSVVESFSTASSTPANCLRYLSLVIAVGRVHITAIAAMGIFTFGWLFTGRYPWGLTIVCALDWSIVNLMNRISDLREDSVNAVHYTLSISRHRRILLGGSAALMVTSLAAVHAVLPAITPLRIAGHLLGLFYNWPLLPGKRRLKDIYFLKNTASGIGFLITVFGYPLTAAFAVDADFQFPPQITWATIILTAVFFFLFTQSYEILYDLRDIRGDAVRGVQTYPVVHGSQTAIHMVDGLIAASVALLAAGYAEGIIPWRIFIMIAAPVLQLIVYKYAVRRRMLSAGCTFLTWMGATLFAVYHLWIAADLPGAAF